MRLELLVERGGRANYTSPTKRTIGGVRSRCCKRCGSKRFQLPDTSQEPACRMMWISLAPYFLASTGATPGTSRCWASLVGFAATRASSVRLLNILNTGTPRRCASPLPHARRPVASASSTPLHDGTLSKLISALPWHPFALSLLRRSAASFIAGARPGRSACGLVHFLTGSACKTLTAWHWTKPPGSFGSSLALPLFFSVFKSRIFQPISSTAVPVDRNWSAFSR